MEKSTSEQTNDFEIHEQILKNLTPGERILYKLKVIKTLFTSRSFKIAYMILIAFFIATAAMMIIREGILFFFEPFSLFMFLFFPLLSVPMFFFLTNFVNKPETYFLVITNKKLFKISKGFKLEDIDTLPLNDIQAISFIPMTRFGKRFYVEFASEQIPYFSKYIFPVPYDLQNVIQIIESILWHSGGLKERLEHKKRELDIHLPFIFSDLNLSSTIELYNDKILYKKDDSRLEIPFSQEFYMTYQPWTKKSGFIHIRPFYDSKENVKFKLNEDYLKIMELIYLYFLSWKNDKRLLLDEKTIEKVQVKSAGLTPEHNIVEEKTLIMNHIDDDREVLDSFRNYIKKDEKILFSYLPNPKIITIISLSILIIAGMFSVVFFTIFMHDPPFEDFFLGVGIMLGSLMFGMIFGIMGPCFFAMYVSSKFTKYVFTSENIIVKHFSKFESIPYNNISTITYQDRKKVQHIQIVLKRPIVRKQGQERRMLNLVFVPKELNLYEKILRLKKEHENE